MQNDQQSFRHESLQDAQSIRGLVDAVAKGIAKGELHFNDEDGDILMRPDGLLHLKLTASKEDGRNRLTIRVTWQDADELPPKDQTLKVNGKKS